MKKTLVLKISAWMFTILIAGVDNLHAQNSQRKHINLDEDWRFHFGDAAHPEKDFNYRLVSIFSKSGKTDGTALGIKFNDSNWRQLNLPHDWAVELPFVKSAGFDVMAHGYKPVGALFPESSIGWYRKHFTVSGNDSGQRFQLQFDGMFRDAQIWINGFYLGNNQSGYLGATYDVTDYLNYDRDNVVVVRVDASQYEGWFYEGAGIYRHVWLNQYQNLHVADNSVFVHSEVKGRSASVSIETAIMNENTGPAQATLLTYIVNRNGERVGSAPPQSLSVKGYEERKLTQKVLLPDAHLWSVENPYLYRIVTLLKQHGKTVDSLQQRFGIRTLRFDASKGFFLNGKALKIKGTNNHQDAAGVGTALPDYLQNYRIRLLKEMGANAYRTSHGAPTPELLDACDSLGMLVLDEQRLLNSSPEYLGQLERLIKRDRNHPSVFLWSIGNEEGWIQTTATGRRIAQTLLAKQKETDPTRTSTYAADLGNEFRGVNEVIPVRGFNYRQFAVANYHSDHPNQPLLGTEMGSTVTTRGMYEKDSVKGYVPDQDITAPWWASTAEAWWTLAARNPYWMGGFIWTGFDYRGEPTPFEWPNINSHFGVMDVCGFPKNIYYYYQSWWTDKDVLHISPHWNWKGKEGKPVDVWVNTSAEEAELFLNKKSVGKKTMPRNGHLQWSVLYEAGTLEAIAFKNGRRLTSKIETTETPAEVVVSSSKTTMVADGKDVAVINISTVDNQGREVPDANNLIHFSVKGDAKIIGVGNGDPSSHEQDKYNDTIAQRHLFNGKAQVIVQAGKTASTILFNAASEGLWKGATDIASIPVMQTTTAILPQKKPVLGRLDRMLGADISFLPELENKGIHFSDNGVQKDALQILKEHGINYIRLRIFHSPSNDSGYSPHAGFCDLPHTLQMAKRIKAAGLKFLLDFHYSDFWADPGHQIKPAAWKNLSFGLMKDSLHAYTLRVMKALEAQHTLPDMVQVGNEINHGMVWPEGYVSHLDSLAQLIIAGTNAVKQIAPKTLLLLHIALGGQNDEAVFFIDNMLKRSVSFDIIGLSYYPKWHGSLDDLRNNLTDLVRRYGKEIVVVEYSQLKKEVADITFNLPDNKGVGTFIWEPLSTWEAVFDKQGKSNAYLTIYDDISGEYLPKKK